MRGTRALLLPTLKGYKGTWAAADAVAGLTLVAIAIPEQVATAHLANMPPVTGFYAFIAGSLVFALFGRHPVLSVGADSTIAPIFAAAVAGVAVAGSAAYVHLVSATALMVGGMLLAVGALRLGWVADFLPLPVVTGLLGGIGVEIAVKQLPTVLGLRAGGTTTVGRLRAVVDHLGAVNGWAIGIAAGSLATVIVAEKLDRRAPGALLAVAASTALVAAAGLERHGVAVVGRVQAHLPHLGVPSVKLSDLGALTGTALTVAFLCVVQTSATVRATGPGTGTPGAGAAGDEEASALDFDVNLAAVGGGSLLAGLSGAFAVDASPPRTAVASSAGGRSQVTGLVAAGSVALVTAFATSLLKDLPEAALGAILLFVASRLFRAREMVAIYRFDRTEFTIGAITLLVVAVVGTEQGVVAAALLALARRTRIAARPRDSVLGREVGTQHWVPPDIGRPTEQVPGVVVYLLYGPIWYGNASYVVQRALKAVDQAPGKVHTLVFDATAMSDVDYTGAKAVGQMVRLLGSRGTTVVIARASHLVHHDIKRAQLLRTLGPDKWFASVEEAVSARNPPSP